MKNFVIASAVAAVMASSAAFAETTAYGKVRLSWTLAGEDLATEADKDGVNNHSSRIGFKFSEDLGNGMKAFARYEAGTSDEQGDGVGTRLNYAGLEGDFGQVGIGSQWTPSYTLVRGIHDPFNGVGCNVCTGNFAAGFRTADAIWYLNKFGEVTVAAALVDDDDTEELNDATDIAISVPVGPVTIGIATQSTDAPKADGTDSWSAVNVGFATGDVSIDVGLFQTDLDDDWLAVTAKYMGFIAQFEDNGNDTQASVGYNHKLSKATSLFAEFTSGDLGDDQTNVGIHVNF
jgi:predicted porin